MSPRKSSTSSGKPRRLRPRYLGLEVAGEQLPPLSPRAWESALRRGLDRAGVPTVRFRIIRAEGRRALAEVDGSDLARARTAWNVGDPGGDLPSLLSRRTWGTLVGAKLWLRSGPRT